MITVDLANPETNLEQLNSLVVKAMTQDERLAASEVLRYVFGGHDNLTDEALATLLESDELRQPTGPNDPQTVEELRNDLMQARNNNSHIFGTELAEAYIEMILFVFNGRGRENAEVAQKKAIQNDWDMDLSISLNRVVE